MANKSISIERGRRIRTLRDKVKLSRIQFEEITGVSASTLRSYESGDRDLTASKARLFANLFSGLFTQILGNDSYETSVDFIFFGHKPKVLKLENLGSSINDAVDIQNEINSFVTNPSFNVLRIQDDLMSPFYKKGDIVVGRKITAENQFPLYQGNICIMESLTGDSFLRKVIKVDKGKVTSCILNTHISQHTDVFEDIEVRSLAQAIRHWHLSEFIQTPSPSSATSYDDTHMSGKHHRSHKIKPKSKTKKVKQK